MPNTQLGPCAKAQVKCTIVNGWRKFVGENLCLKPQTECPRQEGEGYEKCKSICKQIGHAEEVALEVAGRFAYGATAYIEGHTRCCKTCERKLKEAGVIHIVIE